MKLIYIELKCTVTMERNYKIISSKLKMHNINMAIENKNYLPFKQLLKPIKFIILMFVSPNFSVKNRHEISST